MTKEEFIHAMEVEILSVIINNQNLIANRVNKYDVNQFEDIVCISAQGSIYALDSILHFMRELKDK